ncbi:MAG: hypothetical protein IJN42_04970 [Clostridia bacterium]|nr:hypothetical protein [Clostridia bacterium]
MKKILWIVVLALCLTLLPACRPKAREAENCDGEVVLQGTSPANATDGADENTAQAVTEQRTPEISSEESAMPATQEQGEEPVQNEEISVDSLFTVPPEDPAKRAEAERILAEQGEYDYWCYCMENDLKTYSDATADQDFKPGEVIVYFKKSVSIKDGPLPDFSLIEYEKIVERPYYVPTPEKAFTRKIIILLKNKTDKQAVVDAIKEIEKLEFVSHVTPNYILYGA